MPVRRASVAGWRSSDRLTGDVVRVTDRRHEYVQSGCGDRECQKFALHSSGAVFADNCQNAVYLR